MNNDHHNNYINNNNYYRDYINYLYSSNSIIQQNINLLQNNCHNLYHLNRYYLHNQNIYYNSHQPNNAVEYNQPINNDIPNPSEIPIMNEIPNPSEIPNPNVPSNNNDETITNNYLSTILRQIFDEVNLMENENIYNYILDFCITYYKFDEIENPINDECPINQTEFNDDDDVVIINNCNHIFNPDAIKNWFKSNHTCPVCRNDLIENTDYQRQDSYHFRF